MTKMCISVTEICTFVLTFVSVMCESVYTVLHFDPPPKYPYVHKLSSRDFYPIDKLSGDLYMHNLAFSEQFYFWITMSPFGTQVSGMSHIWLKDKRCAQKTDSRG